MRIEKVMDVTIAREIERLERRLLVLATVGARIRAPSSALFGTVWGIMTSFQSIACLPDKIPPWRGRPWQLRGGGCFATRERSVSWQPIPANDFL